MKKNQLGALTVCQNVTGFITVNVMGNYRDESLPWNCSNVSLINILVLVTIKYSQRLPRITNITS